MKKAINILSYISTGFLILSLVFMYLTWPGNSIFAILGYFGFIFCSISTFIIRIKNKNLNFFNGIQLLLMFLMVFTLFLRYFYWAFWDIPGFIIITLYIISSILYFIKEHKSDDNFSFTKLTTILFLLLIIPMIFTSRNGPRAYISDDWFPPTMVNDKFREPPTEK